MANDVPLPTPAQRRALDNLVIGLPADHHVTPGSSWSKTWKAVVRSGWATEEGLLTGEGLQALGTPGAAYHTDEAVLANLKRYGPASAITLRIRLQTHDLLLARSLEALQAAGVVAVVGVPITGVVYGAEGWQNFPHTTWRFP